MALASYNKTTNFMVRSRTTIRRRRSARHAWRAVVMAAEATRSGCRRCSEKARGLRNGLTMRDYNVPGEVQRRMPPVYNRSVRANRGKEATGRSVTSPSKKVPTVEIVDR